VAVLGTGVQARLQAEAVALVRPIRNVLVWGRSNDKAIQCATDIEAKLQVAAMAVELEAAVTQADIVVTTTSATAPYVRAEWLKPGVHVTAMGSDAPSKGELDPHCLARADWIVVDDLAQCLRLGEVKSAIAAKVIRPDYPFVVLGDVLGARPPRPRSSRDITVCDLTGLGIQDTAIASAVVTALDA
jgi:ornithine cyclodeaminase